MECRLKAQRESHRLAVAEQRRTKKDHYRKTKAEWDLLQYSITPEEYKRMLDKQNGLCAICGSEGKGGRGITRKLVVDHCHETGTIRGLLCANCNTGIGLLKENKSTLAAAIHYIEESKNGPRSN
jgi:hypothetical protein